MVVSVRRQVVCQGFRTHGLCDAVASWATVVWVRAASFDVALMTSTHRLVVHGGTEDYEATFAEFAAAARLHVRTHAFF